jgi:2-haloacid dehalogenase
MYDAILFDFDDTLVNYADSRKLACESFARTRLSGSPCEREFEGFFREENEAAWLKFLAGEIGHEEVIRGSALAALRRCAPPLPRENDADSFVDTFCACGVLEPNADRMLASLGGRFKLGIVTNGLRGIQKRRIEGAGFGSVFGSIAISGELGVEKPDSRIFLLCLDDLDARPTRALFVGDSLALDFAGAETIGMDFCYYNPRGEKIGSSGRGPRFEIGDLAELIDLLR